MREQCKSCQGLGELIAPLTWLKCDLVCSQEDYQRFLEAVTRCSEPPATHTKQNAHLKMDNLLFANLH